MIDKLDRQSYQKAFQILGYDPSLEKASKIFGISREEAELAVQEAKGRHPFQIDTYCYDIESFISRF